MARAAASVAVSADPGRVWAFVHDYANWADLLPGYQGHRHGGGADSVWTIRGDVGMVSRVVDLAVAVAEAVEGRRVRFAFQGITERVTGEGEFTIEPVPAVGASATPACRLTLAVEVRAGGALAPVIDALLGAKLPAMLDQFAPALARRLETAAPA